jgi:hypothetical protein
MSPPIWRPASKAVFKKLESPMVGHVAYAGRVIIVKALNGDICTSIHEHVDRNIGKVISYCIDGVSRHPSIEDDLIKCMISLNCLPADESSRYRKVRKKRIREQEIASALRVLEPSSLESLIASGAGVLRITVSKSRLRKLWNELSFECQKEAMNHYIPSMGLKLKKDPNR